ncbi:MAG TPA: DUF1361 domain-containing protein, partial [Candidatus Saccharimonadales bacterium]|nr:DUF1361 domain-containing protein [Candidatus Saccharimonadales bacterium]
FLAWLPLLLAAWLDVVLRKHRWTSWYGLIVSALWVLFLPNSFYMVSDFIHLQEVPRVDLLYDAVMFTSFIFVGLALGISSLYLVHRQFRRRFSQRLSAVFLCVVFALCGFAIYLGRDLRWNSWDVLTNPGGLLFDISDRILHPSAYSEMFLTITSFGVLIASMYALVYQAARLVRKLPEQQ